VLFIPLLLHVVIHYLIAVLLIQTFDNYSRQTQRVWWSVMREQRKRSVGKRSRGDATYSLGFLSYNETQQEYHAPWHIRRRCDSMVCSPPGLELLIFLE
jgi:hypothetical protein